MLIHLFLMASHSHRQRNALCRWKAQRALDLHLHQVRFRRTMRFTMRERLDFGMQHGLRITSAAACIDNVVAGMIWLRADAKTLVFLPFRV